MRIHIEWFGTNGAEVMRLAPVSRGPAAGAGGGAEPGEAEVGAGKAEGQRREEADHPLGAAGLGRRSIRSRAPSKWPGRSGQAERAAQGPGLRRGEHVEPAEPGPQQQLQRGEGQGFGAGPPQHPQACRRRVVEQRGLADSRLAPHDQGATAALPGRRQQLVDARRLGGPAVEHSPNVANQEGAGRSGRPRG